MKLLKKPELFKFGFISDDSRSSRKKPPENTQKTAPAKKTKKLKGVGKIQYLSGINANKIRKMKGTVASISDSNKENIAIISNNDNQYYIAHYKGTNPPRVNNKDIGYHKRFLLKNNSRITLGADEMMFRIV